MPRLIDADEVKRFANSLDSLSETQLIDVLYVIANEIPTVEAIPIEWFKKQIDWHSETLTYGAEVYQWVLNRWYEDKEIWEKENEANAEC